MTSTLNAQPDPCKLFSVRQYECKPGATITCWPLDRIFRQCGNGPAVEVTNALVDSQRGQVVVDPKMLAHPPRGKFWDEIRSDEQS